MNPAIPFIQGLKPSPIFRSCQHLVTELGEVHEAVGIPRQWPV